MIRPVPPKKLMVVAGATAVGKTDVSLMIADRYQCPILSADSRQCYRELGVATAKPTLEMLARVKHYFINSHSIHKPVTASVFEHYALQTLQEVFQKHNFCLMTGGSGLYIKAVCDGMDKIPSIPASVRQDLEKRFDRGELEDLIEELRDLDPCIAGTIDLANPRRVIRALEVCIGTGRPFSSFRTGKKQPRPFQTVKIGLKRDRYELYRRIDRRMDQMIKNGLFEEAEQLYELRNKKPLQTVGYQEIFGFMENQYDRKEAIRLLKRNSRRYAKRQLTWFGKDPSIRWFHADDQESIIEYLDKAAPVP